MIPTSPPAEHTDVVVVGARCAGAVTALLLAARGHDVVLVDRDTFPSDTLSTHAIARAGVVQLDRLGLLSALLFTGAPAIREVRFHDAAGTVARPIKDRAGVDLLIAPRRHVLDALLVDAAVAAGVRLRTGFTVDGVRRDGGGRVTGVHGRHDGLPAQIAARFTVGADGVRSRIARDVSAPLTEEHPALGATHYAYYRGQWPAMEYFLGERSLAGIFPTHDGEACIWVCEPAARAAVERRRHAHPADAFAAAVARTTPALSERLLDAVVASPPRGQLRSPNFLRRPAGPGWALVGDAGYHRDPVTGHGITDALLHAELLADRLDAVLDGRATEADALAAFQAERDAAAREVFAITVALSQFPAPEQVAALQRQLSTAIDREAGALAARRRLLVPA